MSWEEAAADALDAKADTVETAVVALTRIAGMYLDTNQRRHEILSFTQTLEADAENLRRAAVQMREKAPGFGARSEVIQ